MKKKKVVLGTALAIMMLSTVVGCSVSDDDGKTTNVDTNTEVIVDSEKTDKELRKEIGEAKTPIFEKVNEEDLTDSEKDLFNILVKANATGINVVGEDLRLIIPKEGENKVRYITQTDAEDGNVKVYLRKVEPDEKGSEYILGKINKDAEGNEYDVWFYDAETKATIHFEDLEVEVQKENSEKAGAVDVEESNDKDKLEEPSAPEDVELDKE